MKKIMLALAAMVLGISLSAPAEARGGGRFGTEDKIYTIEAIQLSPELAVEAPPEWRNGVTLGRRTSVQWFFLGAWLTDVEYVAVPTGVTDSYWSLTDDQMTALHEIGAISSAAPAYTIPAFDYVLAYSLWIAVAGLALYLFGSSIVTQKRAAKVRAAVGDDFPAFARLALLNAAKADGDIDETELTLIADVLKRAFNMETTRLQLIEEAAGSTLKSNQLVAHFEIAQRAMSPDQRGMLIQALVALFAADGRWSGKEKRLLQRYVVALGTDAKQAERLVSDIARRPNASPA